MIKTNLRMRYGTVQLKQNYSHTTNVQIEGKP